MKRAVLSTFLLGALALPALAQPTHPSPPPKASADDLAKAADATADAASVGAAGKDDLAKAADAAAEVATIPAPSAPAAGAGKASSDDIDLSALGLEPGAVAFDDKLNIGGFADIGYQAEHWSRDPQVIAQDSRNFSTGNLNLYMSKNLTPKARAFAEVQFTFLPNGTQNATGGFTNTTVGDPTNSGVATQWGGVVVHRVYAEYDLTDHLTIRAGHWLTPYGIWNTDHGSPVILATSRPYIIDQEFFPQHQTGLDLFGSHYVDRFKVGFHLTASNGRGDAEAQLDPDKKIAFGGRVEVETPWGLKVGGSYYRGRYTGLPATFGAPVATYREEAYGGDAQFDHGGFHIQGEIIARDTHQAASSTGGPANPSDFGYYVLAGYRFDRLWNIMPFAYAQHYEPGTPASYDSLNSESFGLNFRPTGTLVVKLQVGQGQFGDGALLLSGEKLTVFNTQVAWVF